MKIWILGLFALLLLVLSFVRERFEATPSIKAPPYGPEDKIRLFEMVHQSSTKPPYTYLGYQDRLMKKAKEQNTNEKDEKKLKEIAGGFVSPAVESFFTTVFKPAKEPITEKDVKKFLDTRASDIKDIEEDLLTTYFVGQSGVGTSERKTTVDGKTTSYASMLESLGQNAGYLAPNKPGGQPGGQQGDGGGGQQLPANWRDGLQGGPMIQVGRTFGPAPGIGGGISMMNGNTTGGSSTSSYGPNSGPFAGMGDRRKQVFGPIAMGQGNSDGSVVPSDSSKTNLYPELLGGGDSKPSTRIEGAGVVPPSKSWQLSNNGSLPSAESLKSSVPGDMDLIPDPYRVSQQYSAASYSFKTDPVPFLTDFSAFQK